MRCATHIAIMHCLAFEFPHTFGKDDDGIHIAFKNWIKIVA